MSAEDPGCQHSAGVLEAGVLSETTYNRIIQNIIDAGNLGFDKVHPNLPCANDLGVPISPGLVPPDLHNKELYPDFHQNVMGTFRDVALALDVKGNFSLPFPFWDPFAIGLKLDLNIEFDILDLPTLTPPDLALALNIKIPDLPDVKALFSIPKIPPIDVSLPKLNLEYNLPPKWLDLFLFHSWVLKLPDFVQSLIIPPNISFIVGMLKVPPNVCPVIKEVAKAQMFGPSEPGDLTKIIATAELSAFTGECATIAATSMLVGDGGPKGLTGQLGTKYGFREAVEVEGSGFDAKARNTLIEAFKKEFKRNPTHKEVQFAQIIGRIENGYGTAWSGPRKNWPSQATKSNNWGNIHGHGPAGTFKFIDYTGSGKKYATNFAMYSSPVEGARTLLRHLYVKRPYVLKAINNDKSLYKPIFLMSSRAVYGKKGPSKVGLPGPDAVIPPSQGGLTYYEASPEIYLKNARAGLKTIMKNLDEGTEFDIDAKSNVPYSSGEASDEKNHGTGSVAEDNFNS